MNTNIILPIDWVFLGLYIFIVLLFSYQVYVNLFLGKVSRFSIDATIIFLILRFGKEKNRKRAKSFAKDTDRILVFGVYSALLAVGGIYGIIRWLERFTH